jgi:hypothetical protein
LFGVVADGGDEGSDVLRRYRDLDWAIVALSWGRLGTGASFGVSWVGCATRRCERYREGRGGVVAVALLLE